MVWTKLLYVDIGKAIRPNMVEGVWRRPEVSARYKATLKKHFQLEGLPWLYESNIRTTTNPRHKKPKGHKHEFKKPIHLAKVKKSLEESQEALDKFRRDRQNGRKLTGFDKIIQLTVPSFINPPRKSTSAQKEVSAEEAMARDVLGISSKKGHIIEYEDE